MHFFENRMDKDGMVPVRWNMKRASLKGKLQEDSIVNPGAPGGACAENDQIILNVVGGAVSFIAPEDVPDDEVTRDEYLDGFINCTLQLENGAQILVWINSGTSGVEVQVEPPHREKTRAKRRGYEPARVSWR
jgi:hypothetical protein